MITDNQITVEVRKAYGRELIYPVCPASKLFAALTKTTTLSREDIDRIKELGFTIKVQQEPMAL